MGIYIEVTVGRGQETRKRPNAGARDFKRVVQDRDT